jgi:hypothetical protein
LSLSQFQLCCELVGGEIEQAICHLPWSVIYPTTQVNAYQPEEIPMYEVILHDERLKGNTPNWDGVSGFSVSKNDSMERILGWVRACYGSHGQMEELGIMGHGYVQMYAGGIGYGGHGVQCGHENIYLRNVHKWRAIRGMAKRIIVYACNTADVDPIAAGQGDGRQLCRQLASHSDTPVLAAVRTQYYDRSMNPFHWQEIKFGNWEGPVYLFLPNGTVTNVTPWAGSY